MIKKGVFIRFISPAWRSRVRSGLGGGSVNSDGASCRNTPRKGGHREFDMGLRRDAGGAPIPLDRGGVMFGAGSVVIEWVCGVVHVADLRRETLRREIRSSVGSMGGEGMPDSFVIWASITAVITIFR